MILKILMRVFVVLMVSLGTTPMAVVQKASTLLNGSYASPRELSREVNTVKLNTVEDYAQAPSTGGKPRSLELLNVSYDPTRELWRDLNATFIQKYLKEANTKLEIKQSHGGSSTQAR